MNWKDRLKNNNLVVMNKFKSYFMFSSEHRSGIFLLLILIISVQVIYFYFDFNFFHKNETKDTSNWLAMQSEIDSLNEASSQKKFEIAPFNPNFISDYKGYLLGMSTSEIDRLHKYRSTNKFVNSANEFQNITQISDSLLKVMSPKFKFPDWVINKQKNPNYNAYQTNPKKEKIIVQKDINTASKEEIMEVYGIGDKISDIILQEKEKFGLFASIDQLEYVWGITPESFLDVKKRFFVKPNTQIKKISINSLSTKELSKFPYFKYALAKEIVTFRSMNGDIKNIEELSKINNFPVEKIKIIALYLDFD